MATWQGYCMPAPAAAPRLLCPAINGMEDSSLQCMNKVQADGSHHSAGTEGLATQAPAWARPVLLPVLPLLLPPASGPVADAVGGGAQSPGTSLLLTSTILKMDASVFSTPYSLTCCHTASTSFAISPHWDWPRPMVGNTFCFSCRHPQEEGRGGNKLRSGGGVTPPRRLDYRLMDGLPTHAFQPCIPRRQAGRQAGRPPASRAGTGQPLRSNLHLTCALHSCHQPLGDYPYQHQPACPASP